MEGCLFSLLSHSHSALSKEITFFEKMFVMRVAFIAFFLLISGTVVAQFTDQQRLRGGYGEGRNWWDLKHYDLSVSFDIKNQQISGKNRITYEYGSIDRVEEVTRRAPFQIDLQYPMIIDSIFVGEQKLTPEEITQNGNAYFIEVEVRHGLSDVTVYFHGAPRVAKQAPWDGGVVWTKDPNGKPWVTVACQGLGASCWFPCKDSQVDEPDSVSMHYTCPQELMCVSNGTFAGKELHNNGTATYNWNVSNPINNYCMIPYIGDYVNLHEHFQGEKGTLELDYWVIRGNEEKAKTQFMDVPRTLEALEYWFGPYPFYEDGYKLVEAPHLGMEHQSAIAYGNKYQMGYSGTDLSETGVGLKWDFIIVHESGHEWFGNNITSKDIADMWIHESFTNYSEVLFTDYWFGNEDGDKYIVGLRKNIENDIPIIGPYGVNEEGSGDMYYKGSNMLHTIRQIVNNDTLFRATLRGLNATFWHQTVTTKQIEDYMSQQLGIDLSKVFDQYLRTAEVPTLELLYMKKKMKYRWSDCVKGFNMPVVMGGQRLNATRKWKTLRYDDYNAPCPNEQFYISYWIAVSKDFAKNANNFGADMGCIRNIDQMWPNMRPSLPD